MGSTAAYKTRSIKRRRRSKAEIISLKTQLLQIVQRDKPTTCRHTFYSAVAWGLIEKTSNEYHNTICRLLAEMRREGMLPWNWIADNTRWRVKPPTFDSLEEMLEESIRTYRRALWSRQDAYVEVWCESDSIASAINSVTWKWDVPLMATRGFSSITFLYNAAAEIEAIGKPAYLYYFGDFDPSGVHIDRRIERDLRGFAPDADITFQRVAVTAEQVEEMKLPGAPPKSGDTRSKSFSGKLAVEIESIPTATLRAMVNNCITNHIDQDAHDALMRSEAAERETLATVTASLRGEDAA